jgi:hypothetical protein
MATEAHLVPEPLVPSSRWREFIEWANDGGYDESWHNRWDTKSIELQRVFLEETGSA